MKLTSKVGGFLGFGSMPCFTDLEINKGQYQLGEIIEAVVTVDNTLSSRNVRRIKLKLKKTIKIRGRFEHSWMTVDSSEFVAGIKEEGCNIGEKVTRHMRLQVPKKQVLHDIPHGSTDVDVRLLLTQPTTIIGHNIQVTFSVEVFVHHEGIMENGKGSHAEIPVTIV